MAFQIVSYWTEKSTGQKWFQKHDRAFETAEDRERWLNATPRHAVSPTCNRFMPAEDVEADRVEWAYAEDHRGNPVTIIASRKGKT